MCQSSLPSLWVSLKESTELAGLAPLANETTAVFHSADNVTLQIDGVLYLRILDPFKVFGQRLVPTSLLYFVCLLCSE